MIAALIRWSVANRFLVLLATAFLTVAGLWGLRTTPVDHKIVNQHEGSLSVANDSGKTVFSLHLPKNN